VTADPTLREKPAPGRAERWAVIDVGSDTVHLLVAEYSDGQQPALRAVSHRSLLLELGRDVAANGLIDAGAAKTLRDTVIKYARLARREAGHLVLAATEASRLASNGAEVLASIGEAVGEPIRVLSGTREARLGFLGARAQLKPSGCQLLIDSGGASTELSITQGREYVAGVSLPIGAALLAAGLEGDPPSLLSWALSAVKVGAALRDLPPMHPTRAWATGGSAHHLVRLESSNAGRAAQKVRMADLELLSRRLLKRPSKEIAAERGQDPRRVALLPVGALILGAILKYYGLDACTVIAAGVREGIVFAAAQDPIGWWRDQAPK
jgi:exopolyphosphatase / guanosine-5'-triphosphate,3'-diphosphate pyrophosphatase